MHFTNLTTLSQDLASQSHNMNFYFDRVLQLAVISIRVKVSKLTSYHPFQINKTFEWEVTYGGIPLKSLDIMYSLSKDEKIYKIIYK